MALHAKATSTSREGIDFTGVILPLLALVSAETASFYLLEKSIEHPERKVQLTAAALALFLIVPFAFQRMLHSGQPLASANLYWIVLSLVLTALLGAVAFKQMPTKLQLGGYAIAAVGAYAVFKGAPTEATSSTDA